MKTSTRLALCGFIALATAGDLRAKTPYPDLMRFDTASAEIREYIVHSITGCVRSASIVLLRDWELLPPLDESMRGNLQFALGLEARRCVEVLKGDPTVGGDRSCYFYKTPLMCRDPMSMPRVYSDKDITQYDLAPDEFLYYDYGFKKGRGKHERWRLVPPYDIGYGWFRTSKTARLAFLTPKRRPLVDRVDRMDGECRFLYPILDTADGGTIKSEDARKMKPEELMRVLGVESVFSNRVFSLNEGCVFHVDYELPRLKQDSKTRAPEDVPPEVMRLSPEEVSEVVRLAYAVDGDAAGYDAACARCPQLLRPVAEFRTGIGRMLRQALSAGGMLPKGAPPVAKE